MIYIVDGYNLLFRVIDNQLSLEGRRKELIAALNDLVQERPLAIVLVFDSLKEPKDYHARSHVGAIEIIYTPRGQTADQYIVEELMLLVKTQGVTVVTDDRELSLHCRHLRAKTQSLYEFVAFLEKRKKKKRTQTHSPDASSSRPECVDSDRQIARLRAIFEARLLKKPPL